MHTMTRSEKTNLRFIREESAKCLLCHDAPCTSACPRGQDPARFVRALRFDRLSGSCVNMASCADCQAANGIPPCEKACVHYDGTVRISSLVTAARADQSSERALDAGGTDLSITFCGVACENPFFLSSSVVASGYDMCAAAFKAGWAGIVYKTIGFIKPEEVSPRFGAVGKEGTPFIGFRNLEQISDHPLAENLEVLGRLKRDFPSKVIVSSIMGETEAEWTELARLSEEAGCDIVECNFSCPHMAGEHLGSDVGQDPELVARFTAAAKRGTKLPVLAKMTPNVGNMEIPAIAAVRAGADGLAAINTIKSITGLDLDELSSPPSIAGKSAVSGYSGKAVKPIALRFIHDLAKHPELKGSWLSGMGGIETWRDAAEFIALGCANLQVTTAVMQYGYRIVEDLIAGLTAYLSAKGMESVEQLVGSALPNFVSAESLERVTVSFPRFDRDTCVGCGRCYVSCADGGHQAIAFSGDRIPRLIGKNCVGCHLCLLVCPTGALQAGRRVRKTGIAGAS